MTTTTGNGLKKMHTVSAEAMLATIDEVIDLCGAAEPDSTIEREIRELQALKSALQELWPLSIEIKKKIDLGPFAAKNIADWNPLLADVLMRLDYSLQHDGKSLQSVIAKRPIATVASEASTFAL